MTRTAVLLFPPNWSACVSGPHLAMPLLAGVASECGWDAFCWDLTQSFCYAVAAPPDPTSIRDASARNDFNELDRLYFEWEDQFRLTISEERQAGSFGLLSGFTFDQLSSLSLAEVAGRVRASGTVFGPFYLETVVPKLVALRPSVIGVTIASHHQVIPAIHLLQVVRLALPQALIILGGNILTRLRNSPAFGVFRSHADQTVIYQGDLAFRQTLELVSRLGVKQARDCLPPVAGDERIPYETWAVPQFKGINFEEIGIPVLPYVSTRGCYWGQCSFCAIPAGWAQSGYAGTAPAEYVTHQLIRMTEDTGVARVKFVDEAVAPAKVRRLAPLLRSYGKVIEWEAYARLEKAWEDVGFLEQAYAGGLRKLYLGLEQAPSTDRKILNKNDHGDIFRIMDACYTAGVKLHLFCMVGHPRSSVGDAWATTQFLIDHEEVIDTADLVGFRFDRGTTVLGVRGLQNSRCDWATSLPYEPTEPQVLSQMDVERLERECQEALWESAPRLLHPLYRLIGPWRTADTSKTTIPVGSRLEGLEAL